MINDNRLNFCFSQFCYGSTVVKTAVETKQKNRKESRLSTGPPRFWDIENNGGVMSAETQETVGGGDQEADAVVTFKDLVSANRRNDPSFKRLNDRRFFPASGRA